MLRCMWIHCRDADPEGRPLADGAVRTYLASEQFGELATQRQAEAGAPVALVQRRRELGEVGEQASQLFGGNADAGIAHAEQDHPVGGTRRDAHLAAGGELQCIGNEVAQDLRELAVVGIEALDTDRFLQHQRHVLALEQGFEHAAQRRQHVAHLEPLR
jgi:hypothetical protein